jgi:hypothetical protein
VQNVLTRHGVKGRLAFQAEPPEVF